MMRVQDGDYNGRFILPSGEEAHGTLTLTADKPPSVSLHPELPSDGVIQGRSFPLGSYASELVGYLFTNDEVVIGEAILSEWFPRYVHASGRWALVGLNITQVPDCRWNTLEIRMTGLETILGAAISETFWPSASVEPQRFSADLNTAANYTSTTDDVTITVQYRWSFPPADPYRFSLTNYATAALKTDKPLTVDEWIKEWINPLFGLLTLATGEPERITSVLFYAPDPTRTADNPPHPVEITGQLFGRGIHQQDMPAERRTRPDGTPLIPLFTLADAPPLADLIRTWGTSLGERTATALYRLSMDPTLPPPVRYLLCAQALEGLDTEDHTAKEAAEDAAHKRQRADALEALEAVPNDVLNPSSRRFLKKNILRKPPRSLANRLHHILATIPDHDILVATWMERTEPLVPHLTALDYPATALAERLSSIRNVLSHGSAMLPDGLVHDATPILEALLRGQLLTSLGFNDEQLVNAYRSITDETNI